MNIELVLKFASGTNCRKFLSLKTLFGSMRQTRLQVAPVLIAAALGCALADTLDAQTAPPADGPVAVITPAEGPSVEVTTGPQAPAVAPVNQNLSVTDATNQISQAPRFQNEVSAALPPVNRDLRFDQLPGYQRYKEISDNARKLQEGGRVYKIRWSRDGQKIGFTLGGQKKQFNVADKSVSYTHLTLPTKA